MDPEVFQDGYEYLDMLRRQNRKESLSFNELSRYLEARARKQGVPIHGQFELTPLCNLNCKMCYVHLTADKMDDRSLLTVKQWKDLIRQAYEGGMLTAALTGGECLTYPGFEEVYLYLHSLGCPVDVLTNGVLLDKDRVCFFRKHPPRSIQITLYGCNEGAYERVTGHRVFQTVVENIMRLKDAELSLLITVTPNRTLGEDVFDTIRTAWDLSKKVIVNASLFTPPDEPWRNGETEELDEEYYVRVLRFFRELTGTEVRHYAESKLPVPGGPCQEGEDRGLVCGGGRSWFVVNWRGEMKICNRMEPKSFPLREGFAEAWKTIHEAAENWPRAMACRGCAYEEECGVCAAEALKYARPGEKPEALCRRTRYMASCGVLNIPYCEE